MFFAANANDAGGYRTFAVEITEHGIFVASAAAVRFFFFFET